MNLKTLKNYSGMLILLDRLDDRISRTKASGGDNSANQQKRADLCRCIDEVECWINEIPEESTRVIFLLRFADGMRWKDIAAIIGGGNTEDSVKKRCYRYIKGNG